MTKKKLPKIFLAAFFAMALCGCGKDEAGPRVESLAIDVDGTLELLVGEATAVKIVASPDGVSETVAIEWSSSDESVAIVDDAGNVTAVGAGEAVMYATSCGVTASCTTKVYGEPEIGDFYFSDGTYSKELIQGKTVIGVVFWTGDPARHDSALRRQQPQCTRGLAVSLSDMTSAWQSGSEQFGNSVSSWLDDSDYVPIATGFEGNDPLNLMLGYNNTRVMEAFNEAPENAKWPVEVAGKVVEYRAEVPCPERSSGWYLPSPKEMSLMCSGEINRNLGTQYDHLTEVRDLINPRLEEVGGTVLSEDVFLWTSAECTDLSTLAIMFSLYGSIGQDYKTTSCAVRCILAF